MRVLARSESVRGEMLVRQREDGAVELRVNGTFVMDTVETSSERLLAETALSALGGYEPPRRVFVGGLGLGFTLHSVLDDDRVAAVVVAEIEPDLVRWHREGVIPAPLGVNVLADPRVAVEVDDVRAYVTRTPSESFDLVLLDVDNGPGFLVYDANAAVYGREFLTECARVLGPDGVAAIWSSDPSEALSEALTAIFAQVEQRAIPVTLGTRKTNYHLFLGWKSVEPTSRSSESGRAATSGEGR